MVHRAAFAFSSVSPFLVPIASVAPKLPAPLVPTAAAAPSPMHSCQTQCIDAADSNTPDVTETQEKGEEEEEQSSNCYTPSRVRSRSQPVRDALTFATL
jgi:hypothetical protein